MHDTLALPEIRIRAQPSRLDPNACTFTLEREVAPGGPFLFESRESAAGSPLPEKLFAIPAVTSVVVQGNSVVVGKKSDACWHDLLGPLGQAIRTQLVSGAPAILESPALSPDRARTDSEIAERVQRLFDQQINPSVGRHGGKLQLVRVEDGVVYVSMSGGCQGCGAASLTLRQGVEVMVRKAVPEARGVVDTTDHASGRTPFYRLPSRMK